MPETLGNIFLHIALLFCVFTMATSVLAGVRKEQSYLISARNGVWVVSGLVLLCAILLWICLLQGRFHVEYVYQYTNSTMPIFYKVAALWGGQQGSLLFWLMILCAYSSCVMFSCRRKNQEFLPYVITTLMVIAAFFLLILIFSANPFSTVPYAVPDGRGLNPLLQNYYMIIHPPSLYLGYVGMSIPFAFAISALVTRQLDNRWIVQVRMWTLIAWFFLSIGNLLGASWAYEVLGWGGYWAWDPVENAAFLPWLTASAFIHSAVIQEKRGMLKTWNMVLVILSFSMTLIGTFLTRSGIVSSVHSFAQSDIGQYFFAFLCFMILSSVGLLLLRLKDLESKSELDSFVSRESTFLFNNLILVGAAFAVLWGTLFPVLSEWVRGSKITVGPPYFNAIMIPIGLALLFLTGVGPLVAWRKSTSKHLVQQFMIPVIALLVTSIMVLVFVPKTHSLLTNVYVNISFSLSVFVLATVAAEYTRGMKLRRRIFKEDWATALLRLVASNRRRYGGYVVHVGMVLLFIGFTGSAFKIERELQLRPQEVVKMKNYTLRYEGPTSFRDQHKEVLTANLTIWKDNAFYTQLTPSRVLYKSSLPGEPPQPATDISMKRHLKEDFYTALVSFDSENQMAFIKAIVNPLVQFIWIGGLFLIFGSVIVMWPGKRREAVYA